jgi:hypothetical protein
MPTIASGKDAAHRGDDSERSQLIRAYHPENKKSMLHADSGLPPALDTSSKGTAVLPRQPNRVQIPQCTSG